MIRINIPRVPPSPNEKKYRHFRAKKELRELWEVELWVNAPKGIPKAHYELRADKFIPPEGKQIVRIHQLRKKELDKDNLYASVTPVINAMRFVGLILDDSPQHIELKATQGKCGRLRPSTVIEIERRRKQ